MSNRPNPKIRKDFPPLYLILFLISAGFTCLWALLLVAGYQLTIVDLSSVAPLAKLNWVVVLVQFLFSLLTFIGILKFALLRIECHSNKEYSDEMIGYLQKKLQAYEPEEGYEN